MGDSIGKKSDELRWSRRSLREHISRGDSFSERIHTYRVSDAKYTEPRRKGKHVNLSTSKQLRERNTLRSDRFFLPFPILRLQSPFQNITRSVPSPFFFINISRFYVVVCKMPAVLSPRGLSLTCSTFTRVWFRMSPIRHPVYPFNPTENSSLNIDVM